MDGIRRLKQDLEPESQYYLSTATRLLLAGDMLLEYQFIKYASRSI
jgi:hypothetical protein